MGERPDARAEIVASRHGVRLESVARQVTDDDFRRFDYIIAMDKENLRRLQRMALALGSEASVHLLREWDPDADSDEVPDPYYGGSSGFETVYEMVHRSCEALLRQLRAA